MFGMRRKKLDDTKRREIAEAVISGRKTAAQMARMFGVSAPTVSRIVAAHVAAGAHQGPRQRQPTPEQPC
jgi:transposase-like protein